MPGFSLFIKQNCFATIINKKKDELLETNPMLIEILHFEGCPSSQKVLNSLREVLSEDELEAEIHLVNIENEEQANIVKFPGSPTIRVNGEDIESVIEDYGMKCRLYNINGRLTCVPGKEYLRKKIMNLENPSLDT